MRTALGLLFLISGSFADEVHLKNGNKLRGIVREEGERIVVQMDMGSVTVSRSEIVKIVRERSPLEEFAVRRRSLREGDAEGHYRLGLWARESELHTKAREAFEKAIALDPDHEGARRQLGYRKHQGRWFTEVEHWTALGFVRHRGEWLPRGTVEKMLEQETSLRRERENRATLEKIAELEAEIERLKVQAFVERERLLAESERKPPVRFLFMGPPHYHSVGGISCPCWCDWKQRSKK